MSGLALENHCSISVQICLKISLKKQWNSDVKKANAQRHAIDTDCNNSV